LVDLFASLGVEPSAVVGHSSGEVAAAYAVGSLTATEAITVAFHRGLVTKSQMRVGAMAAIGMSWEEVERYLVPGVTIGCENSPKSVTLSGDADKVEAVVADIQASQPDMLARLLKVDKAYNLHHQLTPPPTPTSFYRPWSTVAIPMDQLSSAASSDGFSPIEEEKV